MKTIYKPKETHGFTQYGVSDDYPTMIPFTEVPPLENVDVQQFNFTTQTWSDLLTTEDTK